jgi:hypothetical protein
MICLPARARCAAYGFDTILALTLAFVAVPLPARPFGYIY